MTEGPRKQPSHHLLAAAYVLPIASKTSQAGILAGYLRRMSRTLDEVIVVDGSAKEIFDHHAKAWSDFVRHIRPAFSSTNGKVAGVITGVRAASHEAVIIADDDVRYRKRELLAVLALLQDYDVVRPQNHFVPSPWHARWDTARSLLNRLTGGDWPGTLGVKRSALIRSGGYSGEVLFENLELVQTIRAMGGREAVPFDLFVARRPPSSSHFFSQRVRQAYDEFARPARLALQLSILPVALILLWFQPTSLAVAAAGLVLAAELGRRRGGGGSKFPWTSAIWAIPWVAERSVTIWVALAERTFLGGVNYRGTRLKQAATPLAELQKRLSRKANCPGQHPKG